MGKEKAAQQLKHLKETKGPIPKELRDFVAEQTRARKAILDALKEGPRTVPEIAAATGLPADKTLWHVTGLRKYGKVEDLPGRAAYPKYALKNGEAKS
jgi:predicted Rossmann fold nucleotide-binding protein DprA/Smf involved in DNA uptake